MRRVYMNPQDAAVVARRGQTDIGSRHAPREAGAFVVARLEEIRAAPARAYPAGKWGVSALIRAELAAAEGPGGGVFGGKPARRAPTGAIRRLLLRALWPFLKHQNELDRALVTALDEFSDTLRQHNLRLRRIEEHESGVTTASLGELERLKADIAELVTELHATQYVAELALLRLSGEERVERASTSSGQPRKPKTGSVSATKPPSDEPGRAS